MIGDDFNGEPIPFTINPEESSRKGKAEIEIMLINDDRFEPKCEEFYLQIMVNKSNTEPLQARLLSEPALFRILDDEDSK